MIIIKAQNIEKSFTKTTFNWRELKLEKTVKKAVDGLTLEIEEGEFVGFLGPNGAGKTTFLKMLSGIIHPTSGGAKVLGFVPWERNYDFLRQIAIVMGQKNQLWWDLPAYDSFNLLKAVYSIKEKDFKKNLEAMVETLGMQGLLGKRLRHMSLGERMKCELTASFLHNPKVIFLDEPTIGLDIVSSQAIRDFLKTINRERKCTIVLTSHYMGDIEELCKRVIIINHGRKIYDGGLNDLKNQYEPEKKITIYLHNLEDKKKFAKIKADKKISENRGIIKAGKEDLGRIAKEVFDEFSIDDILISDPDTEEVISQIFQSKSNNNL